MEAVQAQRPNAKCSNLLQLQRRGEVTLCSSASIDKNGTHCASGFNVQKLLRPRSTGRFQELEYETFHLAIANKAVTAHALKWEHCAMFKLCKVQRGLRQ
eukprot:1154305-Pelagomonas_calceolata.AAC.8